MRSNKKMPIKLAYAPHALLLFICFILCATLFHELIYQNLALWVLVTVAVTGGVFGLVYLICRMFRSWRDSRSRREQDL